MFSITTQSGIIIINVVNLLIVNLIDNEKDYAQRCLKAV